jgi:hypothetical protein
MSEERPVKRKPGRPKGSKNKPKAIVPAEPDALVGAITKDLDEEERQRFALILKSKMSLEERAEALVELARFNDTKRAPVGLRAIQEINAITGVHDPKPAEVAPMFVFPEDTRVAIAVQKVEK